MRKIEPAKNYDVVSFARAMNQDFAPRLKKLFDPEVEAALTAQKTGKIRIISLILFYGLFLVFFFFLVIVVNLI